MLAHVQYEAGVHPDYIEAAELAYTMVGRAANQEITVYARPLEFTLPMLREGQYDSDWIGNVFATDPDVSFLFITKQDLGVKGLNFCFGRSAFDRRVAMASSYRIKPPTMVGLALHEIGHSLGLVDVSARRHNRISIFAGHCTNSCVMEPVNDIQEMDSVVQKVLSCPHSAGFCSECAQHIAHKF